VVERGQSSASRACEFRQARRRRPAQEDENAMTLTMLSSLPSIGILSDTREVLI
jgi:hypothetical protein